MNCIQNTMRTLVLILLCGALTMCDGDDGGNDKSGDDLTITLQSGTWRVTYFFEDVEETGDFSGYNFTFANGGVASVVKGGTTFAGSWSIESSSNEALKLVLDFGGGDPLEELNEDWRVLEQTTKKITLEHVSGGDGSIDTLIIEKN